MSAIHPGIAMRVVGGRLFGVARRWGPLAAFLSALVIGAVYCLNARWFFECALPAPHGAPRHNFRISAGAFVWHKVPGFVLETRTGVPDVATNRSARPRTVPERGFEITTGRSFGRFHRRPSWASLSAGGWLLIVPLWTPLCVAVAPVVIRQTVRSGRAWWRRAWACEACGYDQRGLDQLAPCPECGSTREDAKDAPLCRVLVPRHVGLRGMVLCGTLGAMILLAGTWIASARWGLAYSTSANDHFGVANGVLCALIDTSGTPAATEASWFAGKVQGRFQWWFAVFKHQGSTAVLIPVWSVASVAGVFAWSAWRTGRYYRRLMLAMQERIKHRPAAADAPPQPRTSTLEY